MARVLKNGALVDGTGALIKDAVVVIEGSTIVGAGKAGEVKVPEGENEVLDLGGMTIMPGMMDLHDHLWGDSSESFGSGGTLHDRFGEAIDYIDDHDAYLTVLMVENARKALAAGFTTLRDTGSPRDMTLDIGRASRDGLFVGPRIQYAASMDISYPADKKQIYGTVGGDITGVVDAVRVAREKIGAGADWLHLFATGAALGFWAAEDNLLTLEEMKAATDEAHKLGKRATANACGPEGMKNAILAGVDCIEHGTHIGEDDEVIPMMLDRGVPWVPTLYVSVAKKDAADAAEARGEKSGIPDYWLKRELELIDIWRRGFEKAMEAGVVTGLGTDTGAPYMPHGRNAKELEMYVRYGASEMDTIVAATRINAEIMGMDNQLGTVEEGKEADLVVLTKDPLKDITVLQDMDNIALVFMSGKVVADNWTKPA